MFQAALPETSLRGGSNTEENLFTGSQLVWEEETRKRMIRSFWSWNRNFPLQGNSPTPKPQELVPGLVPVFNKSLLRKLRCEGRVKELELISLLQVSEAEAVSQSDL